MAAVSSSSAPYRVACVVILLCGGAAAAWLYRDTRRSELSRIKVEFERRATIRNTLTRDVLERYEEALYGLSSIFAVDQEVTRTEFNRASQHLLGRLPGVVAFEWVPIVPRAERNYMEAKMRRMYAPHPFSFTEFDRAGLPRKAADRPLLYPICYVEPMAGNESVLGYDIATGPTAKFLEIASGTGRMVATNQFRLRQETQQRLGVVMILPVVPARESDQPGQDFPSQHPAGFLQCIFRVGELLEKASGGAEDNVVEVLVIDDAEDSIPNRRLYYSGTTSDDSTPTEEDFRALTPLTREFTLLVGGRPWRLIYRPRAEWVRAQQTTTPWWRATTLLALSGLLAGFVATIGRRTAVIHREVDLRTAELAESRRQLANLLHSLPGMAFRAKYPDGLEMIFVSEGALALTGWAPDEFIGGDVDFRRLIHPEDAALTQDRVRNALAERKDLELEFRLRTRQETEKWVLARARGVYGTDGSCDVIEGILIDITDQKRAEESRLDLERKLLETQKLESLGLLAGGIAHDFNNLLSAILGNASLARLSIDPGSGADAQLRAIETASLRAAELCRQMLAYAGKGRFVIERVDLSAIVQDLLPLLRVSIARSAELQLDLKRELPGVKADATQIRQIVMNLVLNAVDAVATGRTGAIAIRTGLVAVDRPMLQQCVTGQNLPLGPYVMLEVKDNGCGMSSEVRSKIFDPFFTTKFAGRGLGLAAVLGIVRGHNGALSVESEVGAGTTFRLYLPAIAGEIARLEEPVPTASLPWTHTGHVLVMEDEEPVRVVMAELLKSFGFEVKTTPDGMAGLEAFRADPAKWTLIIIDLLMPGMSGEETLAALQQLRADVRVLLVSGYTDAELTKRKRGPGRVAFLPKPFRREAFEAKLKDLFAP